MRQVRKLREIAIIAAGQGAPQGEESYCNDGIPFIKAGNLLELINGKPENEVQKVNEQVARIHKLKIYPQGTVLFAKSGMSCMKGYVYQLKTPCYVVSHLACITPTAIKGEYLKYYFEFHKPNSLVKDEAYPSISLADIGELSISYCSEAEQTEVVRNLDKITRIINERRLELKKLDDLVKSQFIEMFGNVETNSKGYVISSVGLECSLKSGSSLPADKENEGGDVPYVKVGDMSYNGCEKYVEESSHMVSVQTAGNGLFPCGTTIFPKRGGAIGTNKKRLVTVPVCADLNVMGVIPGKRINPQYLYCFFLGVDLGELDNGSSVPQINNKDIAPLKILVPPMEAQIEFARFVEQTDKSKVLSKLILKMQFKTARSVVNNQIICYN